MFFRVYTVIARVTFIEFIIHSSRVDWISTTIMTYFRCSRALRMLLDCRKSWRLFCAFGLKTLNAYKCMYSWVVYVCISLKQLDYIYIIYVNIDS